MSPELRHGEIVEHAAERTWHEHVDVGEQSACRGQPAGAELICKLVLGGVEIGDEQPGAGPGAPACDP